MHKSPVLVRTQSAGLIEVIPHANVTKIYAHMTSKGIMEVYPDRHFENTIANLGIADVHLPKLR